MTRTLMATHTRGWAVKELVIMGFTEKHRASEVLPQLQRLRFEWSADFQGAVAVEVESDGRLRMTHSHLLDPAAAPVDGPEWQELLSAIVPLPHAPIASTRAMASRSRALNAGGSTWLKSLSLDPDFVRNAAALLGPGRSAVLAMVRHWQPALPILSGYSGIVLHTAVPVLGEHELPDR